MKILAFTTDVIPLPGLPTSGTALRTFGLIQGLRSHGHEVTVSVPKGALQGMKKSLDLESLSPEVKREIEQLECFAFDPLNQQNLANELKPDAILCGHWPAVMFQNKPSQALILDLAGPHLLERHYQQVPNHRAAVLGKLGAISKADYFIVSGPTQRLYFLSFLLRAQIPQPEKRIVEITMPLDPNIPTARSATHLENSEPKFIFGGVFLPWQNPAVALEQTASFIESQGRGSLKLIGGSHPNYKINDGVYEKLFQKLSQNKFVSTQPMLPYERFLEELSQADIAVDVMKWNLERELALTIRSTTYLWSGLPVIYNNFADLGKLIQQYNAGWTVTPGDQAELETVLKEIYTNPTVVTEKSANARRLSQEVFAWDKAVRPLLNCLTPRSEQSVREIDIISDFPDTANFPVRAGEPVEQVFLSRIDGLSRVECRLATHNRAIRGPITVSLYRLRKEENTESPSNKSNNSERELLSQTVLPESQIRNNEWLPIDIAPISDSAGRAFVLRIESKEVDSECCVSPWAVKGRPYPLLELFHGPQRIEQTSLCLRTTCAPNSCSM